MGQEEEVSGRLLSPNSSAAICMIARPIASGAVAAGEDTLHT
jgi:hypothetical protein